MTPSFLAELDATWTLFLDRDGVINTRRPGDYVKQWAEFEFLPGAKEALALLKHRFARIVVVTNQQGIGKGLMTVQDLLGIHQQMQREIVVAGGRLDAVYFCPDLETDSSDCRKPRPGMAHRAQAQFPEIDFTKSVMVGDSESDMEFGLRLGMHCIYVSASSYPGCVRAESLAAFSAWLEHV